MDFLLLSDERISGSRIQGKAARPEESPIGALGVFLPTLYTFERPKAYHRDTEIRRI
jgi:hypothetical protein